MFGIVNLPAFILAGILLNLAPGADTMYILGRSIAQGKKAGIVSALGIVTGVFIHTILVAFGLSLIVARSPLAFSIVKYAGAIYLACLGFKMLIKKSDAMLDPNQKPAALGKLYASGILTNVLNPKVALFFIVFLPQFVRPENASSPLPFILLGIIFVIPGTIWCLMLAVFSAMLSKKISQSNRITLWLSRVTGGLFIALGLKLALLSKNS